MDPDDVVASVVSNVTSSSVLFNITFHVIDIATFSHDLADSVACEL